MPTVRQERSVMYLRNTGEGRDVLRILTQVTDAPVRRVFRQLAELGVPCSMTEELVGVRLEDWRSFDDLARMKLQALWSLTEGYWDTARRLRGAAEGLEELILDAKRWGVYYDPPSCTMAAIEHKAYWARKAAERRARDLHRLAPLLERYHPDDTEPMRIRHYEPLGLVPEDRREWAKHPRMTERDPRGRKDVLELDDAKLLELFDTQGCVNAFAREHGVSRQAVDYRMRRAVYARARARARAREGSGGVSGPPTPLVGGPEPGGLPLPNFHDGAPRLGGK